MTTHPILIPTTISEAIKDNRLEDEKEYYLLTISGLQDVRTGKKLKDSMPYLADSYVYLPPVDSEEITDEKIVAKAESMGASTSWCDPYSFEEGAKWMREQPSSRLRYSQQKECVHPYDDVMQDENGHRCSKCNKQITD